MIHLLKNHLAFGSAAIDLAWVADGRINAGIMLSNSPWDTAAGVIIAREAGATVVDLDGSPHSVTAQATIAASPKLVADLVELIAEAQRLRRSTRTCRIAHAGIKRRQAAPPYAPLRLQAALRPGAGQRGRLAGHRRNSPTVGAPPPAAMNRHRPSAEAPYFSTPFESFCRLRARI
ncbi:inositol monophosphatase family protein [Nonomuraea sp. LP-02]|uniref:inositol monophosphatase family protein n=1 Tax=Nonomuraea sp. LP-02 TaxID=3097960 RepID=UPI002E353BBC|nr:inositol monophosphatase family protein [Nonomuraea sp. LP-02]MED7927875.1 inositol monophosphatase family protein [Nonomuraea sp. LP-02]